MVRILSINPGATSTKTALYENEVELFRDEVYHDRQSLKQFKTLKDQLEMRYQAIMGMLNKNGFLSDDVDVVVSRGGILPPVDAGAILIDDALVDYLLNHSKVAHPANLGAAIALRIVTQNKKGQAYVYDPISVDQLSELARISGLKGIQRGSVGHMLNSRAVALKYAKEVHKNYDELNLIVVHAGTGITLTAHQGGRMVDIVADDEGPFSPERTGGLPLRNFMDLCYTKDKEDVVLDLRHRGGLVSYFDTNDVREVEALIDQNNAEAKTVLEAMAYQISKSIGQLAPVLKGDVDAIIISGGFSRSILLMDWIKERVSFIADVVIYPGEYELEALSLGGLRAFRGEEKIQKLRL